MDIVDGMKYLHDEHDSIHRDLKSANILLSKDERDGLIRGKVADFGMSKLVSQEVLNQRDDHNKEAMSSLISSNDSEEKQDDELKKRLSVSSSSSMMMTLTSGRGTYVVCVFHYQCLSLSLSHITTLLTHITKERKRRNNSHDNNQRLKHSHTHTVQRTWHQRFGLNFKKTNRIIRRKSMSTHLPSLCGRR